MSGSILGNRVVRVEDPRFLTGNATYITNLALDGAAHVVFVRSTVAHARVEALDVTAALKAPGVVAVVTAADLDLPGPVPVDPGLPPVMARQILARDVVRFVGEPVAAVVADTPAQAADAAALVEVGYTELPVVVDPEAALADETLLFPEHGTNVAFDPTAGEPVDAGDDFFDGCEVVVRQRIAPQRLAPSPLEGRAAAAEWVGGRLRLWASTQAPHRMKPQVAALYGLQADGVQIISPDVGGGFGAKTASYPEYCVMGELARRAGRPVKWVETRSETMLGLGHGRGQTTEIELGGTRDGKVLAARLSVLGDAGAYAMFGALLPRTTLSMGPGVYDIPKFTGRARSVVTNTVPTVAYRGAGRPEATYAIERAMDIYAAEIGKDPAEVRRQNLVPADAFPFTTATGVVYDSGAYAEALDQVLKLSGYDELRAQQRHRRERGDTVQMGIGVSTYVEITNGRRVGDFGAVHLGRDGTAVIRAGTHSHGQGHATTYGMVVADVLGIPLESTRFVQGDTDLVPNGIGTFGSRSIQTSGASIHRASAEVLQQAHRLAAELLEAAPDDIVQLDGGAGFGVAGVPSARISWPVLAAVAHDRGAPLEASSDLDATEATFPFGAHVAVVEVDTETGRVRLDRIVTVDDAGRVLNPLLLEGQLHGGLAQGISQVLYEDMAYDDTGNPRSGGLADYGMPSAADLPSFEVHSQETPTPLNVLGAKGAGEAGTIGSIPAVAGAVVDALSGYGIRHLDLPATPQRVWRAIADATTEAPAETAEPARQATAPVARPRRRSRAWWVAAAAAGGLVAAYLWSRRRRRRRR